MRISLITVCHKSKHKIAKYVQSFLDHHNLGEDRSRYEFVFIENSGEKDFQDAVKPLIDAGFEVLVLNSENQGFGTGCNTGAQYAKGEMLLFVNPDIQFLCNLSALQDPGQNISWGTVRQMTGKGSNYSIDLLPEYKSFIFEAFQIHSFVNRFPGWFLKFSYVVGSFMLISKELFDRSGGFNPSFFLYYEEAEFARRLQALSGPPRICAPIAVLHEGFGSQTSHDATFRHEAEGFLTYCKITDQPWLVSKRIRIFKLLSLLSSISKKRLRVLQEVAAQRVI